MPASAEPAAADVSAASRRPILIVASLISFLVPFMASSVNVALPAIGADLAMGARELTWVATAYLLATAIFLVPVGRLADLHGRKLVFRIGLVVSALSSLLLALAPSTTVFLLCRFLQGVGSAMIFSTSGAILVSVYPASGRGQALGINVAAVYLGLSVGPVLGGILTEQFCWGGIFLGTCAGSLALIAFAARKMQGEWAEARGERFDLG